MAQTPGTGLRHPSFGGRCRKAVLGVWGWLKLQALVYDILPLEEGAEKRCSECGDGSNSRHCFTTSFLWRKVPKSAARSVWMSQTPSTALRHPSFGGRYRKAVLGVWGWLKLQALVYDILPSTTAVFSYAIGL